MNDYCPCGALVRIVTVDVRGWIGNCEAGHSLHFKDLETQGRIV